MVLDAVLEDRTLTWLATERDKVTHFTLSRPVPREELPRLTFVGRPPHHRALLRDKLPIGVSPDGAPTVFLYLVTRPSPIEFRAFLERHAELLRALPAWTLRLLVPQHLARRGVYTTAFLEQLAMPLRPETRDELRWYFDARRAGSARAMRAS
jgi:hypothetical protein